MLCLLPLLLVPGAAAQAVSTPPLGARIVTVLLCAERDGCPDEAGALAAHAAERGLPVIDFDRVAAAALAGEARRADFEQALAPLRQGRATLDEAQVARRALQALPFTVPARDQRLVDFVIAQRLLERGDLAGADEAFRRAASGSGGDVVDLPAASEAALVRYAAAVELLDAAPATLSVVADGGAGVAFVDGRRVGPLPATTALRPGWHRITVERTGRRTAWVGEVQALPGRPLLVRADLSMDDGTDSVEAGLLAATAGKGTPSAEATARLAAWADAQGLRQLRFVRVVREEELSAHVPEERFLDPGTGQAWAVFAAWLDVGEGTLSTDGPGLLALASGAGERPFTATLGLGWAHLGEREHVALEIAARWRWHPWAAVDLRVGVLRAGQPYYLYEDWVDPDLFPVALGAVVGRSTGPYGGIHALAVVPYTLGGEALGGWAFSPGGRWTVALEARGGYADKGWLAGGTLQLGRSR